MPADDYPFDHDFFDLGDNRVINECRDVSRVACDITSKPLRAIERE